MSRSDALANVALMYGPIVFGFVLVTWITIASETPVLFRVVALGLCGIGFCLFLIAKISVMKLGTRVSFGSPKMSTHHRRMYRAGYALMIIG